MLSSWSGSKSSSRDSWVTIRLNFSRASENQEKYFFSLQQNEGMREVRSKEGRKNVTDRGGKVGKRQTVRERGGRKEGRKEGRKGGRKGGKEYGRKDGRDWGREERGRVERKDETQCRILLNLLFCTNTLKRGNSLTFDSLLCPLLYCFFCCCAFFFNHFLESSHYRPNSGREHRGKVRVQIWCDTNSFERN